MTEQDQAHYTYTACKLAQRKHSNPSRSQIGTYLLNGSRFVSGNVHGKQRRIETVTSRRPQIHVHCRSVRHAKLRSLCKNGG
ncbi:hypothetical protein LSAT2_006177, partial [Lamellibrachia satsuma]